LSEAVLPDPQFTLVKTLRPFEGFEAVYQGQPASTPVAFPGGLSPDAGKPGFDPNLMAGISVPLGARIVLWIPLAVSAGSVELYTYTVYFRLRNVTDFRNRQLPYHIGKQFPGVPDTTIGTGGARFVIPAASQVILYEQAEPAGAFDAGVMNLRNQQLVPRGGGIIEPLLPGGGTGVMQQGVYDPVADPGLANDPIFNPFWFDAEGDELIILAQRTDQAAGVWDFSSTDLAFSNIYGTGNGTHAIFADLGIYMLSGVNP
jgi:hypothetical protein